MNKIKECLRLCFDFKNQNRLKEHDEIYMSMIEEEKCFYRSIDIKTNKYSFLDTVETVCERHNIKWN